MGRIDDPLESVLGLQYDIYDRDATLAAYAEISARATVEVLPKLLETLRSDRSDFFVREILAAPIAALGGPSVLEELLAAFQRNHGEGHDNDGMSLHLIELVEADPSSAANELKRLLGSSDPVTRADAAWLLEFAKRGRGSRNDEGPPHITPLSIPNGGPDSHSEPAIAGMPSEMCRYGARRESSVIAGD